MPVQDKITELGNLVDSQFQNASVTNKITAPEVTDAFGKVMSIAGEVGAELAQKTITDASHTAQLIENQLVDTAQTAKDAEHDAALAQNDVMDAGQSADIATLKVLGEIKMYVGQTAPTNWAMCHGQMMPIADNSALYAVIGNAFGGDSTTFALPDFRNRFPMGAGVSVMGVAGGSGSVTLAAAQMPTHSHTVTLEGVQANINTTVTGTLSEATASGNFPATTLTVKGEVAIPVNTLGGFSTTIKDPSQGILGGVTAATYSGSPTNGIYSGKGIPVTKGESTIPQTALNLPVSGSVNVPIQTTAPVTGTVNVESTGEGQPVSITPPYLAVNYIIRVA